jgi:hypothetical protein
MSFALWITVFKEYHILYSVLSPYSPNGEPPNSLGTKHANIKSLAEEVKGESKQGGDLWGYCPGALICPSCLPWVEHPCLSQ